MKDQNNFVIIFGLLTGLLFISLFLRDGGFLMAAEEVAFSCAYEDTNGDGFTDTCVASFKDGDGKEVQARIAITEVFNIKNNEGKNCALNPQGNILEQYLACYPEVTLTKAELKAYFESIKLPETHKNFANDEIKKAVAEVASNPNDPRIIKPRVEPEDPFLPDPNGPGLTKADTVALVIELELVDININSTDKNRKAMAQAFKACYKGGYDKYREAAYLIDRVDGCFNPISKNDPNFKPKETGDFSLEECEARYGTKNKNEIYNAAQKEALGLLKQLRDNFPDTACLEKAWELVNCGNNERCANAKDNLKKRYDDFWRRLRSCLVIAPNPGRPPQKPIPNPMPNVKPGGATNVPLAQAGTFIIKGTGGLGSTFFIGKSGNMCVFATNDHVVKDNPNMCIDLNKNGNCENSEKVGSNNICTDGNQELDGDLALVKLPCTDQLNNTPQLSFIDWQTKPDGTFILPQACMGKLYQIGYPGGNFTTKECKFDFLTPAQIQELMKTGKPFTVSVTAQDGTPNIDCGLTPGASGGPIVNASGQVCAVISTIGRDDKAGGPANSSYINRVLNKCPGFKLN